MCNFLVSVSTNALFVGRFPSQLSGVCMHGDLKALSILLCLCTDEYPLMVAGSCQYHGWRSKVRLSDYMRCVVCLDLSGHTTSPCVLSLCKTLFAFFGMLLVVVGYHLVLDGPHVLRCVLSNIRCYMQCVCVCVCAWAQVCVSDTPQHSASPAPKVAPQQLAASKEMVG